MKNLAVIMAALATVAAIPQANAAGRQQRTFVVVNEAVGVPVFPNDITDRPYEVVGPVEANVRKATVFSNEASQEKIYRELWERAERLNADAVINARYGDSHITALSWGSTKATGTAIRFTTAPAATPAAAPAEAAPAN